MSCPEDEGNVGKLMEWEVLPWWCGIVIAFAVIYCMWILGSVMLV
ncbi:MAG: hypothetical protein ACTSPB_00290 [Candidatus Thorarchaeota archaeon]